MTVNRKMLFLDLELLWNGELVITNIQTGEQSHLMITRDRCHFISRNGSIWQRRRRFKEEWLFRNAEIGWKGYVPLPFNLSDAEGSDTDIETTKELLQDSAALACSLAKKKNKKEKADDKRNIIIK